MKEMNQKEKNEILLDILQYLHDICEKHNLTYMLAYGTLLGAIRHKGFIPWDDDVDVIMPIEDYKKAVRIINNNDDGYTFYTCESHDNYPISFGKISRNDTITIEEVYAFKEFELGVNIDVFPLYKVDKRKFINSEKELKKLALLYKTKTLFPIKGDPILKNILKQSLHSIMYFVSFNKNAKKINKIKENCHGNDMIVEYGEYSKLKFDISDFEEVVSTVFEDKEFKIPSKYDKVLTNMYGDYMTPPDTKGRKSTHKNKAYYK